MDTGHEAELVAARLSVYERIRELEAALETSRHQVARVLREIDDAREEAEMARRKSIYLQGKRAEAEAEVARLREQRDALCRQLTLAEETAEPSPGPR